MKLLGHIVMTGNTNHPAVRKSSPLETMTTTSSHEEQVVVGSSGLSMHLGITGSEQQALKRKKRRLPSSPTTTTANTTMPPLATMQPLATVMNSRPTNIPTPDRITKPLLLAPSHGGDVDSKPQEPSPVEFLKSILPQQQQRQPSAGAQSSTDNKETGTRSAGTSCSSSNCLLSHRIFFSKPSEEEMAAYDLEVVSAIRSKDVSRLRSLRDEGRSFNACNRFGESLLHMACRRGDLGVVTFLIEEAAVRIDVRDDYGRTALHDACWTTTPNRDVMDVLLQVFPTETLLAEDVRGHTPFDYARKEHWVDWMEFLHERKDFILKKRGAVKVVA